MEIDFGCHPNSCGQDTSLGYRTRKYLDLGASPRSETSELVRQGFIGVVINLVERELSRGFAGHGGIGFRRKGNALSNRQKGCGST